MLDFEIYSQRMVAMHRRDQQHPKATHHRLSFRVHIDSGRYVMGLFSLAHDSSTDVRKVVCTGLVQMLHLQPQKLQSHMTDIIEYMLQSNQVKSSLSSPRESDRQ